jgi:homoserine dehydrogenase
VLRIRVRPEEVPAGDVLAADGADGVLVLETDLMGEIGLWEGAGGVDQTAYAILADLVEVARAERARLGRGPGARRGS